ncbi:hypothetical protein [Gottfriedia luciferensis]|uniref:hypothetical protein n=1 Tax=Gottfriedia luciferensis TaxID=178774 RepID=UPI000B4519FD|nr:hypothetical protein [Gottfriedia luciferensis]
MAKKIYGYILILTILISNGLTLFDVVNGSKKFKFEFILSLTILVGILLFLFDKLVNKRVNVTRK